MIISYGRILSVDKDATFRQQVKEHLDDSGFTLYEASNGDDAFALFEKEKPDLVLSSLHMPVAGGEELLEKVRKASPETPLVVISSPNCKTDLLEALRLGAWDYVIKPLASMAIVEHAVCRALERGRLVIENKNYRRELEEKNIQLTKSLQQLKDDQEAGKSIQQQLLPPTPVNYGEYHFSHKVIPSLYLSGDFIDYFLISEEKLGFYIADVSGHGASSAFVTILLKSLIEQILNHFKLKLSETILAPEKVLKWVNDRLVKAKLGKYLTMVYGVLDLKTNMLHYSVGGHYPQPILCHEKVTSFLPGEGMLVGAVAEATFTPYDIPFPKGLKLALFSDGVLEAIVDKSLVQKENTLLSFMKEAPLEASQFLEGLNIQSEGSFPDDITLLLIHRI